MYRRIHHAELGRGQAKRTPGVPTISPSLWTAFSALVFVKAATNITEI